MTTAGPALRPMESQIESVAKTCTRCGLCVRNCGFLTVYGDPKTIAQQYDPSSEKCRMTAFECSLCGLCSALCPNGTNPSQMFLQMRGEAFHDGCGDFPEHAPILRYEARGTSSRYTWYGLPAGCDTVFFPGCTLAGTRWRRTIEVFEHLRQKEPLLGIVLDCCCKPSHDLGRRDRFAGMFGEMKEYLAANGVRKVIVACPNCHSIFRAYGQDLALATVYEVLDLEVLPQCPPHSGIVTIHDPCAVRFEKELHAKVRGIAEARGVTVREMPHHGKETFCCGEGGSVGFLSPRYAKLWRSKRCDEARGTTMVTYCAGCAASLGRSSAPVHHLLDLAFDPTGTLAGGVCASRPPMTYLNRLRLKRHFKRTLQPAVSRERTFKIEGEGRSKSTVSRFLMLALVAGAMAAVHATGVARYLEEDSLRRFIDGCGALAPILYMLAYAVAPALFIPGLPITVVGGILFGPFWGVVYTITGATAGACIAFLTARFIAGDWVRRKLRSPKWKRLDDAVQHHGWKVVAFTRLIPLFPFNLLNYAFGLTRIRFMHYAAATFVCMLPACIAFIVFSSSLLDFIRGRISPAFLLGLGLIAAVSCIPILFRRYRRRKSLDDSL